MNWWHKYWWVVLIVAIVLCLVILVEIFKSEWWLAGRIFEFLGGWALILSATATVTLAAVAFWSIRKTIKENRRIRDEDKQSDFKRHRLDDIRNWALEAIRFLAQQRSLQTKHDLELQIADLEPIWAERASIVRAGSGFNKNFQEAVKDSTRNLEEYFNILNRIMVQLPATTEKEIAVGLRETTRKSFVRLLESVAELKVELQL